jgi:superfamily II DNA helicase RecQ
MRNQIEMAGRIGIRAYTIHSANRNEWDTVEVALRFLSIILTPPQVSRSEHLFVKHLLENCF